MILEELVEKLARRLCALERALKEKGILDEVELQKIREEPEELPQEIGERIRTLNSPEVLNKLSAKKEVKDGRQL